MEFRAHPNQYKKASTDHSHVFQGGDKGDVFLALLLWGISHEMEGERDPSISEEEDLELERELRRRNKPAIKSFQACCTPFLEFIPLRCGDGTVIDDPKV